MFRHRGPGAPRREGVARGRATSAWPAPCGRSGCPSTTTSSRTGSRPRRRGRRSASAGGGRSSGSRPATRSTARTSTSRSARSRSSTACSSIRSWARRRATTSRRTSGCSATRRCSTATTPRTARWSACSRRRCATPGRGGDLARDLPQELRVHALHRRSRPRRRGNYYGTYDAQEIFEEFEPGRAGHHAADVRALLLVQRCEGMASPKTCPHGEEARVSLGHAGARDAARGRAPTARVLAARGRRHPHRGDEGRPGPGASCAFVQVAGALVASRTACDAATTTEGGRTTAPGGPARPPSPWP